MPYILCKNRDYSVISGYFNCWGWVGSSKNWKERSRIEFNKININEVIKKALPFASKGSLKFWKKEFNYQLEGVKYNWDARFMFDVWVSGGFFLYLPGNYSSNIGVNATSQNNTKARRFNYLEIKTNQNKVSCEVGRVSKGFDTCVQKIIYLSIYRRIKLAITLKGWFF